MSQAEELLDSLPDAEISTFVAGRDTSSEPHIVVGIDRFITVPEELKRIAVQYDHDVETVTFDCPRYCDGLDMSKMKVYVNYMRKDGVLDCFWCEEVTIDENDSEIMHFDWTISRNVSLVKGELSFLVCVKTTDEFGDEKHHWNSELNQDMYVSEGLECLESIVSDYPDIVTQLLVRMDYIETIATPETMQDYVDAYLKNDPTTQNTIQDYTYMYLTENSTTIAEIVQDYVASYMEQHPTVFVIGSTKPVFKSVWFNTDTGVENVETTAFTLGSIKPSEDGLWFDTGN